MCVAFQKLQVVECVTPELMAPLKYKNGWLKKEIWYTYPGRQLFEKIAKDAKDGTMWFIVSQSNMTGITVEDPFGMWGTLASKFPVDLSSLQTIVIEQYKKLLDGSISIFQTLNKA